MTEKITVGIIRINGLQALEDCIIDYEFKSEPQGTIDFQHPTIGRHRFTGIDVYEAFEKLKAFLESGGYNILCAGSRINTFPSTMSRQIGGGIDLETLSLSDFVNNIEPEFIKIFDKIDILEVVTLEVRNQYFAQWLSKCYKSLDQSE